MQHLPSASVGKAIGIFALVFFSGFATGLLSSNLMESFSSDSGEQFRIEATLQDLSGRLSLNPSQTEQIRVVLDDVIMEEAELLSELKWNQLEARQRIIQYLTPEQTQRFNEMMNLESEGQ